MGRFVEGAGGLLFATYIPQNDQCDVAIILECVCCIPSCPPFVFDG